MLLLHFPVAALLLASVSAQTLPVIDLGKTVHRAQLNVSVQHQLIQQTHVLILKQTPGDFYTFKNIPYAEPPLGELRFRKPIPLLSINRTINDGSSTRVCIQGDVPWFQFSIPLLFQRLAEGGIFPTPGPPPAPPSGQSEDCLLLDVSVPKQAYDSHASSLPVIVWIHGGAYIGGSKEGVNPAGLFAQSRRDGAPGVIFVSINYRL